MSKQRSTIKSIGVNEPAISDPSPYVLTASLNPVHPTMGAAWIDRCSELLIAATRLQEQLPVTTRQALAPLLAHMNCYYSNLIEGHRTYPGEVEHAVQSGAARAEAIRANAEVLVVIEPETRTVRTAGVEGSTNFPPDVTVSAVGARSEMPGEGAVGIRFFPDGGSTGGSVTLARGDAIRLRILSSQAPPVLARIQVFAA